MPGLVRLNDLEKNRAILDIGGKKLIYPGPGKVTYNLPPGSIEMPLKKNPNGAHLCLSVNDYVNARAAANATTKQSTQHAASKSTNKIMSAYNAAYAAAIQAGKTLAEAARTDAAAAAAVAETLTVKT